MKNSYRPLLIAVLIIGAIQIGRLLMPSSTTTIFTSGEARGISKFNEILNYIEESYVDTVEKEKLIEDGIESLLYDLDPHSYYIPKNKFQGMNEGIEGKFEGVGIEFRIIADTVMVITTVKGGPSEKAGVKPGDRLIEVNDSLVAGTGISNSSIMDLLKGERASIVRIGVRRDNAEELIQLIIKRDRIPISSIPCFYMLNKKTGYIRVSRFSKTTYEEFKTAIDKLLDRDMNSLVIDMRDNPGGLLNEAIQMANEFLKKNKVIVYTEGKARPKKIYYADQDGSLLNDPLIILLDEGSASASEVFAGAIQDNDRGTIVGRRSFGKGLVQEQVSLPDGSALRLTVARYYTPTGRSIQKPYKNVENYDLETYDRLERGELESADSIQVLDSLRFYTPQGKVVYGGGGIVPDVFIPLDSLVHNDFYNSLYRKPIIINYAFRYADSRRKTLIEKYPDWERFNRSFDLSEYEFEKFLGFAARQGIERNPKQVALLKQRIKTDLKAQIARHIYGDDGFFPILNQTDPAISASLELLK